MPRGRRELFFYRLCTKKLDNFTNPPPFFHTLFRVLVWKMLIFLFYLPLFVESGRYKMVACFFFLQLFSVDKAKRELRKGFGSKLFEREKAIYVIRRLGDLFQSRVEQKGGNGRKKRCRDGIGWDQFCVDLVGDDSNLDEFIKNFSFIYCVYR